MLPTLLTPQPLGIFPLPAGYLILPPVDGVESVQASLLEGRLPAEFPPALRFYELALAGDISAALSALDHADSPEARYNRFVLEGDPTQYPTLAQTLTGDLRQLLDVAAYTMGMVERPPERGETAYERLAFVLMAQAAYALERDDLKAAIPLLEKGIHAAETTSPLLAAQLRGTLAETLHAHRGADSIVIQNYREALHLMEKSDLAQNRAELWLNLGIAYQEMAHGRRGALLEATACYQQALKVFTAADHPELYALAHNNLALAYLAMPLTEASDQLRSAIAIQSLREALKIYTQDTYPEQWASAQLNLANALQYLPSTHPEENLIQAVELYEEILATRVREDDPLGYARLLANQGNALSHLGIFVHAQSKLEEAHALFLANGEPETAQSVEELLVGMREK
ncbi:MAG TPA: hypothetical protein PK530_20360 [Anaerolineales bacterium]|nr:hypothetical protein [Anaerolineales bacterium]